MKCRTLNLVCFLQRFNRLFQMSCAPLQSVRNLIQTHFHTVSLHNVTKLLSCAMPIASCLEYYHVQYPVDIMSGTLQPWKNSIAIPFKYIYLIVYLMIFQLLLTTKLCCSLTSLQSASTLFSIHYVLHLIHTSLPTCLLYPL